MKKIIFCLQTMVYGGVEKELITVLKRFDYSKYDVTLLLFYQDDEEILKLIPKEVELINLNVDKAYYCSDTVNMVKKRLAEFDLAQAGKIAYSYLFKGIPSPAVIDLSKLPSLAREYDCAVCYHMHSSIVLRYVAEKIKAKKKVAWIHNDFATTGYKIDKYLSSLKQYDEFIGVSKRLSDEFVERLPQFAHKTHTIHNIVDEKEIFELSKGLTDVEPEFLENKKIKIVTVGRFVEQKGFDIAIEAAKILKEKNIDFTWYAIGYGTHEKYMKAMVDEYGLKDDFIIVGKKDNPYPYIANADLYVQPSRHEGFAVTVLEAQALDRIIVCTNFAGADEQIDNGFNGIIAPDFTPESIANIIENLINNPEKTETIKKNISCKNKNDDWGKIENVFN